MKTCKKCKKSVPNNLKICRYCGADVSKIKPNNKKKVNNSDVKIKKETLSKKENNEVLDKTEILETKVVNLDKTEILETKVVNLDRTEVLETVVFDTKKINEKDKEIEKQDNNKTKKNNGNKNKKQKKEEAIEKKEEVLVEKIETEELSSFNVFEEKTKKKEKVNDLTKAQQIYYVKKNIKKKKITNFFLVVISLLLICYLGYNFLSNMDNLGFTVDGNEPIEEVSFNMGDMINYQDIRYIITGVETSTGTAYKKPKKDNIYLIVSLSLENKSDKKHKYSGAYWTMLDSSGEETNRIISPVNAGEDLYSGNLVVGGKKEASLVFEVPEKDKELFLQYYNGEEKENYEKLLEEQEQLEESEEKEEIKKPNPKFRVKIKVN